MAKRCFVISPIGDEGSAIREHADDVFEFIIQPAMEELGLLAYRADHSQQLGRITDHMFRSILEDDLCIAVLTSYNPNVFYELAIAQSAARPVIILIEKGQSIPFDIRDLRAVEYDLKPRPLRDKVYVKQIIELVRKLEAANWTVSVPFGQNLSPLGARRGHFNLYEKEENYGTSERWLELLNNSVTSFDLAGISHRWWTKNFLRSVFVRKAEQGCQIRILLMHPDNPALPQFINNRVAIGGYEQVAAQIKSVFTFFTDLSAEQSNIQIRQIRRGCIHQQLTKNDDWMLLVPLLYSNSPSHCPLMECSRQSVFYKIMQEEFEHLWVLNAEGEGIPGIALPNSALQPAAAAVLAPHKMPAPPAPAT